MTDCRIEFALLSTVCSLPVASHPASRRRSYLQLSGAGLTRVRTFTQLFVCTRRRTRSDRPGPPPLASAARMWAVGCCEVPLDIEMQRRETTRRRAGDDTSYQRGQVDRTVPVRTLWLTCSKMLCKGNPEVWGPQVPLRVCTWVVDC